MIKKGIVFGAFLLLSMSSYAGMTVCNKYSCQPSDSYNSEEILDVFGQVFSGGQKELVFCEADSYNKKCMDRPLTFSGRTNWVSVQFRIPFVRILQVQPVSGVLRLLLDYQIQANQYYPVCKPVDSTLSFSVSDQGDYLLTSPKFNCQMTELGNTDMEMRFTLDYMDLDKGYIGATYQSVVQGDVLAGGSGYVLMKLSEQRMIELPRPVPKEFISNDGHRISANQNGTYQSYSDKEPKLVDWDWDNIKTKWDNFKVKFLKVLYLEPIND